MFAACNGHKEIENLLNLSLNIDNIFLSSQYEEVSDGMLPDLFIGRYRALWNKFGYDDTADYHIEKIRNTVNNTEIKEQLIEVAQFV